MVMTKEFICTGCNELIKDRYIFRVDDQKLHYNCLKCCKCKRVLNGKCWYRQNKFYCKEDYDRLIQMITSCIVCKKSIEKNTLKHTFYNINVHLNCFRCYECSKVLNSGDHFVIINDNKSIIKFACSSHYTQKDYLDVKNDHTRYQFTDQFNQMNNSLTNSKLNKNSISTSIDRPAFQHFNHYSNHHNLTSNSMNFINYKDFNQIDEDEAHSREHLYDSYNLPIDHSQPASDNFIDNYWAQVNSVNSHLNSNENLNTQLFQRTKSRSRKRKIKINNFRDSSDVDLIEKNLDYSNNSNSSSSLNQVRLISSNSSSSSSMSSSTETTRLKRNRTSFKPYQLKMMKDYFSINKNPDSKELLQLSQQTQLSKRTLQVFFQNHRANLRKKQKSTHHNQQLNNYLFKIIN